MLRCIELKNQFFIPIADVRAKVEQPSVVKNTEDWCEARQRFHIHVRNMLMVEGFVFVEKQRRIEVGLAGSPEMLPSKTSIVIGVKFSEEYVLAEEIISLEFWLVGEGILWLGLRSVRDL